MAVDFPVGWLIVAAILSTLLSFSNPMAGIAGRELFERDPDTGKVVRIIDQNAVAWACAVLLMVVAVLALTVWLTFTALLYQVGNKYLGVAAVLMVINDLLFLFRAISPKKQEVVTVRTSDGQQVNGEVVGAAGQASGEPKFGRWIRRGLSWYRVAYLWYLWAVVSHVLTDPNFGILPG